MENKNSSKREYVLLTSNMYRPNLGGIENSLYYLSQEYKNLGYNVIIVASDINHVSLELPVYECEDGVEIFRYRAHYKKGFIGFYKHFKNAILLYRKILKEYSPSVVICRYHFNLLLLKLTGFSNVRYLIPSTVKNETKISLDSKDRRYKRPRDVLSFMLHKILQQLAFAMSEYLLVFSENMRKQVFDISKRTDILMTKPGVNSKLFFPIAKSDKIALRKKLGLSTSRTVFICVGRLIKVKGFDTAIEAINAVKSSNIELWILGSGDLDKELKELTDRLECHETVRFLGKQSNPEIYYRAADYFVMSSIHEALGQTIIEALATGLPIITAPSSPDIVTASSEIIDAEHNYFTKSHSVEEFSYGFTYMMNLNEEEYRVMSEFNRCDVEAKYSWNALAKTLVELSDKKIPTGKN